MKTRSNGNRCQGRTKAGKACRAAATAGGLCYLHANPNKAAELGRAGGKKNRHVPTEAIDALPKLNKASEIRDAATRLLAQLLAGKLNPAIANSSCSLLNVQLKAINTADLEQQIESLEQKLREFGQGPAEAPENEAVSSMASETGSGSPH